MEETKRKENEPKMQMWQLQQRQSWALPIKEAFTETRIRKWYDHWDGDVFVSFSGGKDSTVLLHMVRKFYPNVPAVFVDTGVEYPEVRRFVKTFDNVVWLKPKMDFKQVIEKHGYPIVSKEVAKKIEEIRTTKSEKLRNINLYGHENGWGKMPEKWRFLIDAPFKISPRCCDVFKKRPVYQYCKETGRKPFIGTMTEESRLRRNIYLRRGGCNAFDATHPSSTPLSIWTEKDIWEYIKKYNLPYCSLYDKGAQRTGCMFCMFGAHLEGGEKRFHRLKRLYPHLYKYAIETLGCGKVMDYLGVDYGRNSLW